MRRLMLASLLGISVVGCGPDAVVVRTDPAPVYVAQPAPPVELVEARPAQPQPGLFWIGGHWRWEGNRYVWQSGHWERERPYEQWVGPHWQAQNGQWVFEPGHWRRVAAPATVYAPPPPPPAQVAVEAPPPPRQVIVEPPQETVVIVQAPPAPRMEVAPPPPYRGAVWIGGFWRWEGGRHVWVGGHFEAGRPGMRWEQHRWERFGASWRFVPGRWR